MPTRCPESINQAVQGKHQRADQGGETEALVSPDLRGATRWITNTAPIIIRGIASHPISDQIQNQSLSG